MKKTLLTFAASIFAISCHYKSRDECRIAPTHDFGSPFHPDFCRHADRIVVGIVENSYSRHGTMEDHRAEIVSDVQFRITHVLSGPGVAGDIVELTVDAVEQGDGVTTSGRLTDGLHLITGTRYLLFLAKLPGVPKSSVLAKRSLTDSIGEEALDHCVSTGRWGKVCAANPEGVHTEDIIWSNLNFLFGDCPLKLHR